MSARRVVIIGAGPAGYVAAIRASQLGAKVTLIEQDRIGGTCLNRGCIPTKALLSDAKLLRKLRHSSVFAPLVTEDFNPLAAMMERKRNVVEELVKGVEMLLDSYRVNVKKGRADLFGANQVILNDGDGKQETFEADAIILGPGSKSKTLPNMTPDGNMMITSDEALELEKIPREIVIVGGGYIGAEFATLFNLLGSRVTLVEVLDDLLPGLEAELVRHFRRSLEGSGVKVLTKSTVDEVSVKEEAVELTVKTPQGAQRISAEKVLLSVGRAPHLDLDFSKAGVVTSRLWHPGQFTDGNIRVLHLCHRRCRGRGSSRSRRLRTGHRCRRECHGDEPGAGRSPDSSVHLHLPGDGVDRADREGSQIERKHQDRPFPIPFQSDGHHLG